MLKGEINIEIDKYIKKFYLFKILKGAIYLLILLGLLSFSLILLNFIFYFSISTKTILFWTSLFIFLFFTIKFIVIPFLKYLQIIKPISYEQASINISNFYEDIQDRLVNILELSKNNQNSALILASINQKYNEIKLFNFSNAIDFKQLLKYSKYIIIPIFIYFLVFALNSTIISQGFEKFTNYTHHYEKPLPFSFNINNKQLTVQQGDSYKILLELSGQIIPEEVIVNFGANAIIMNKNANSKYEFFYDLKSVNRDISFYFEANGYKSKIYTLKVIPSPKILNFKIDVFPPKYTHKKNYSVKNSGDLIVPYGSKIIFNFTTNSADSIYFITKSQIIKASKNKNNFIIKHSATKSFNYDIIALNKFIRKKYFTYNLNVLPDFFPSIILQYLNDSTVLSNYYYYGKISDDYGFSSLFFNYKIVESSSEKPDINNYKKIPINFSTNNLSQEFYYTFNFSDLISSSDKTVYYYFSVYDNDIINNYKRTISQIMSYSPPSIEDLDSIVDAYNAEIDDKMLKANQLALDLQNDLEDFNQKLLNENLNEWEKKEFIDNLLFKQKQLERVIDSLKKSNSNKLNNIENFSKNNQDLLDKQKQIQKLLDQLLTPELKKLIDDFKKLKSKFNDKSFDKTLKKSNSNYKKLQQDLDRSRELLKRISLEQKLNNKIQELDKLSKDFKNLSETLKKSNDISDILKDSISDLNK
ncbi:MAG: DUF4175 family protein, partial [Bacteroidota bacterium]|nr:DUF4175 family protein [Bacteroidota bacterium]